MAHDDVQSSTSKILNLMDSGHKKKPQSAPADFKALNVDSPAVSKAPSAAEKPLDSQDYSKILSLAMGNTRSKRLCPEK